MKQLPDFDLSIIMPFYKRLDEFKRVFPSKAKYYERNGIEVVIVLDEPTEQKGILEYIRMYPFINWKVVVNNKEHSWRNPAKAFNVGIRQATKQYVMIMDPELEFYSDAIFLLREKLEFYTEHYAIGQVLFRDIKEDINNLVLDKCHSELLPYGSIMAKKEYFEQIGGFYESYTKWGGEDDNLRKRLELSNILPILIEEAILVHREDFSLRTISRNEQRNKIPRNVLSGMLLPIKIKANDNNWGNDFNTIIYDWKEHPFAKEQCPKYLTTLKQFELTSNDIFHKSYPLIALIPTYNEAVRIADCLRSVEKYCDGIIILDDDSQDNTYEIAQSDKLLLKAKKVRTEFNDKQNRNILLDIASFFRTEWLIFIDADEQFDDRFVDIREVMKMQNIDIAGIWIANLWDKKDTYRIDLEKDNFLTSHGLWLRWRMMKNKGRMQFHIDRKLHFKSVPYTGRHCISKTLILHHGYLNQKQRISKYQFYKKEDKEKIMDYEEIINLDCKYEKVQNVNINHLNKKI